MYDKVKIWLPNYSIVGEKFPTIANYLDNGKEITDIKTGEIKTTGNKENLKIYESKRGVTIIGSLPKYLNGDNIGTLDIHSTKSAIEKMSDALHIDVNQAKVTEFEFGKNFFVKYPVQDYLSRMGEMPYLCKYHFNPSTLYYQGNGKAKSKRFVFYDKLADAKAKGMTFPAMNGFNLLRYEMRLCGAIHRQLRVPLVYAKTLYEREFYRIAVKRYQESYFSISKKQQLKINYMNEIKTVNDACDVMMSLLLNNADPELIEQYIAELKRCKVFKNRNYYCRLKRKIKDIKEKANFAQADELIKELDNDIRNVSAYV